MMLPSKLHGIDCLNLFYLRWEAKGIPPCSVSLPDDPNPHPVARSAVEMLGEQRVMCSFLRQGSVCRDAGGDTTMP